MAQPPVEIGYSAGVRASTLEYLHACPICKQRRLRHYCRVPSLFNDGEFIHYERCADCGTAFRNPRLPGFYREERCRSAAFLMEHKEPCPVAQAHRRYVLRLIKGFLGDEAAYRLLDFGCGAGEFLVEARAQGFHVTGLELNHSLAACARSRHGVRVLEGMISQEAFKEEKFDVITAFQVFEHLVDPVGSARELREHLTGPRLLYIEVPNLLHIRERLRRGSTMDDSHLFYFTPASLSGMLDDAGLEVLLVQDGLRPFRLLKWLRCPVPDTLVGSTQRLFSLCQVKTAAGVIARAI